MIDVLRQDRANAPDSPPGRPNRGQLAQLTNRLVSDLIDGARDHG
jgi:hypothetical protein